jgi:hypothetical protein
MPAAEKRAPVNGAVAVRNRPDEVAERPDWGLAPGPAGARNAHHDHVTVTYRWRAVLPGHRAQPFPVS